MIGAVISHAIIAKNYPYALDLDSIDFVQLKKKQHEYLDVSKYPEVLLIVVSIILIATVALTTTFAPKGGKVAAFSVSYNGLSVQISPMLAAFGSILVVITEMVLNLCYRTYTRKILKIRDQKHWYLCCLGFDVNFMSFIGVYMMVIAWVVLCYDKFRSKQFLIWGVFLPAIVIFMLI
jgi:hypothetical protein